MTGSVSVEFRPLVKNSAADFAFERLVDQVMGLVNRKGFIRIKRYVAVAAGHRFRAIVDFPLVVLQTRQLGVR